jgi:predicted lipoprotein with Yx(FWY)xxD motif
VNHRDRIARAGTSIALVIGLVACGSNATANPSTSTPTPSSAAASVSASTASAATSRPFELKVAPSGPSGPYLTDGSARALYTFDSDSTVSACNGQCAVTWPPFTVASGETPKLATGLTGKASTAERADSSFQAAYNGKPLYFYSGDAAAGDTKGDGVGGLWHLARP